jgi:hypothetical protein
MSDSLAAYYAWRPDVASAACVRELVRQWLTTGLPTNVPAFIRRAPLSARIAAGQHLPSIVRDVVAQLREMAATPGHLLSGPHAGALPGLARTALSTIGDRARTAADLLHVPRSAISAALGIT